MFHYFLLFVIFAVVSTNGNQAPKHVHLSLSSQRNQMNVAWYTQSEVSDAVVQYSTKVEEVGDGYEVLAASKQLTYGEGFIHRATLHTLQSDTVYYYRVGSLKTSWTDIMQFKTRRDEGKLVPTDKVRILAYGDMGVFPNSLESVDTIAKREVLNGKSDFVLHVGDLAYAFGNFTKWDMWFNATQEISSRIPYMLAIGNRDEPIIFKERFTMPTDSSEATAVFKPESRQNFYYSFDYHWVHVVSLSINDTYTPGSDQYKWIELDLKNAATRVNDPHDNLQWIVFIGHTPMYSSSNGHTGGNKILKGAIEPLLYKYNVTLAIWGDDHVFERSYPLYDDVPDIEFTNDGKEYHFVKPQKPIHLLVGTAGIDLDGWLPGDAPSWSAYREMTHGYVKIEASKHICNVKFVRKEDGSIADEISILKKTESSIPINTWVLWTIPIVAILAYVGRRNRLLSSAMIATQERIARMRT